MKEGIVETISKLFESPESLLIVLGAVLLALGASGGVTYHDWFPVAQLWGQALLSAAGFLLVLVGALLVRLKPKSPKPYGISITKPTRNESVRITDVEGTIRKRPIGYSLWIFRVYSSGRYTPLRQINPLAREENWVAKGIDVGGVQGESRELGVYLVGQSGAALIHYYQEAVAQHRKILDKYKVPEDDKDRWLPALGESKKDLDMIERDRIPVLVK